MGTPERPRSPAAARRGWTPESPRPPPPASYCSPARPPTPSAPPKERKSRPIWAAPPLAPRKCSAAAAAERAGGGRICRERGVPSPPPPPPPPPRPPPAAQPPPPPPVGLLLLLLAAQSLPDEDRAAASGARGAADWFAVQVSDARPGRSGGWGPPGGGGGVSGWQRAEAAARGPARRLHLARSARGEPGMESARRVRLGAAERTSEGGRAAAARAPAPDTRSQFSPSEGHPAFLALRAEDLAWAVPATWGTRRRYPSPCASLRPCPLHPSLPFNSWPGRERLQGRVFFFPDWSLDFTP